MYSPKQEKSLQKAIIAFIHLHGGYCQSVLAGVFPIARGTAHERWVHGAEKGAPDIIACIKGKFLGIEIKKDTETAEKWTRSKSIHVLNQKDHKDKINKAGGLYSIVGSLPQLQEDLLSEKLI